jgi:hypothetical protein
VVSSTVLACKATLKLSDTLDDIQKEVSEVRNDGSQVKPSENNGRDLTYVYLKSAGRLGRLYGPALGVGVVSIACLSGAHINLTRRNTSLMAAYAALQGAYDSYRDRIRGELGVDREHDLYRAVSDTKEDGEIKKIVDPNGLSAYARFFDEYSDHWEKDAEHNLIFLRCQQNYLNDLLRARGHVFLNEAYDALGIDRSSAGAVVGWLIGSKEGDSYIDFGIYDPENSKFVNGWENSVLLDFNVDGVIYDKL